MAGKLFEIVNCYQCDQAEATIKLTIADSKGELLDSTLICEECLRQGCYGLEPGDTKNYRPFMMEVK